MSNALTATRQWKRFLPFLLLIAISLSAIAVGGCDSADYNIVRKVKSPDSAISALLVQRRGHDSLSSDVFYVVLVDHHHDTTDLPRAIHDKPILVATHGQEVELQWISAGRISVVCANCGIQKIDVIEKRDKWDSIAVTFVGFPEGTATTT